MNFPVVYTPEPSAPAGGPQRGTKILQTWIVGSWDGCDGVDDQDPTNLGIYNPRDVCGNPWPRWKCKGSQHARGAAGDDGFPVVLPGGHPEGHKLAAWLVEHHVALGIQEVIWAKRRWKNSMGVIPHGQWPEYHGRSEHLDHVHWAQNDPGAKGLTLEMIKAVMPMPAPTPEPPAAPAPKEEDMLLIREKGKPEVYLVTGGLMIHVRDTPDLDAIVAASDDLAGVATLSTPTFNHFKISHKVVQS